MGYDEKWTQKWKKSVAVEPRSDVLRERLNTDDVLHLWVTEMLRLKMPRVPVCPHHNAPFDYLKYAYFEPARDLVVWAPRGGGKTRLGAIATMLDLLHKDTVQVRILGGSLEQSLRMWDYLRPDLEIIAPHLMLRGRASDSAGRKLLELINGSSAAVLAQSQRSVRGLRVQKLRCDEVELFDPGVWEAAQLTTRSSHIPDLQPQEGSRWDGRIRATIEALSTFHKPWGLMNQVLERAGRRGIAVVKWCVLDALEKCPPQRSCDGCKLWDECRGVAKTRCDGYMSIDDAIDMKERVSEETWKSEMLCQRPSTSGAVFPTFNRAVHVLPDGATQIEGQTWLGIDFGFNNPFVCLWIVEGQGGVVHVVDEHVQEARTVEEHVRVIEGRLGGTWKRIACDPAGNAPDQQTARSNVDVLRRHGYRVHTRGSKIQDGLELIRAALKSGTGVTRLFIHARCTRLIDAMEKYHYAPGGSEVPVKDGSDHAVDALRYFFVNRNRFETRGGRAY